MSQTKPNCRHCGKPLRRPEANYCTHCGAPLKEKKTVHGGSWAKVIIHLPGEETQEVFLTKMMVTLGRHESNLLQIVSPIVSGEHAMIELTRKGHIITDIGSTNGTYLNGQKLQPHYTYLLTNNDIIRFSDSLGNSAKLTYIAPSLFGEVNPTDVARTFEVTSSTSFIGRNPRVGMYLNHPAVSWNHAKVMQQENGHYAIQDMSSNNGTFVNGQQLQRSRLLTRGDTVQIGPFNLVYQGHGKFITYSAERNFRLETVDVRQQSYYRTRFGLLDKNRPRMTLNQLNVVINPREFVALVGASGTGKTTLLKTLSGLQSPTHGTVLVNSDNLYDHFNIYRTMMGYVPQDDIVHRGLSVRRVLQYAARLRLPDANNHEIRQRIDEVLEKVTLSDEGETMVRDLSGGQRKRVSIAVELLAEPWIFFLDEPTSGLDPGLEKLMMDTLRQLADEGRTIVLVTHATNNLAQNCDHVAILAQGGKLAYFGPPDEALRFFGVADFSDIYTHLAKHYNVDDEANLPKPLRNEYRQYRQQHQSEEPIPAGALWSALYRHSLPYQSYVVNRQTGEVARPIASASTQNGAGLKLYAEQFFLLSQRYLDLIRHDATNIGILLAVMPVIGLLLLMFIDGSALVGNTVDEIAIRLETNQVYNIVAQTETLLFMMALAATMLGLFSTSFEIVKEKAIYQRERMVNLRVLPYFASKFVVLSSFAAIQSLLLLMVLALNISFPSKGAFLWSPIEYYLTLLLAAIASIAFGLFLSTVATSRNMVIYLVLLALFGQIVFSGAVFELSSLTEFLSHFTITRWALEAFGATTDMDRLNQLGQVRVEREIDLAGRGIQRLVDDIQTTVQFHVNYSHTGWALLSRWCGLLAHTTIWSGLAVWWLRRQG